VPAKVAAVENTNQKFFAPPGGQSMDLAKVFALGGAGWAVHKADGTIVTWASSNGYTPPAPAGKFVEVVCNQSYCLARRSDGTVAAFGGGGANGANLYGEATVPAGLNNAVGLAIGSCTSYAVKSDGTVAAWGQDLEKLGFPAVKAATKPGSTAPTPARASSTTPSLFHSAARRPRDSRRTGVPRSAPILRAAAPAAHTATAPASR
jgi:hypothetical protein